MDWTMLGAIGELLGAAAVVATLLYLSRQIAITNRISKAEAWRGLAHKTTDIVMAPALDEPFRAAYTKILIDRCGRDDLSQDELMMLGMWIASLLYVVEQTYREVQVGILPADALNGMGDFLWQTPYFRESWPLYLRPSYSGGFQTYMDELIELGADTSEDRLSPPAE